MRQGEETKPRPDPEVEIQERGEIFFFYRPKVGKEEEHDTDDVQRMYIVLCPESGERSIEEKQAQDSGKEGEVKEAGGGGEEKEPDKKKLKLDEGASEGGHGSEKVDMEKQNLLRFIVMGRKSLPDPSKHGRPYWGFVEIVTTKVDDIKKALKGEEYEAATGGHRKTAEARALGEGAYRILRHKSGRKSTHTHLIYKLEFPTEEKPQESMLNIEREGSFIIQLKNPDHVHLQSQLGKLRFRPVNPPDFLNYEGCEFLLISSEEIEGEEFDLKEDCDAKECSDLVRRMFPEAAAATASKPLLSGTWV